MLAYSSDDGKNKTISTIISLDLSEKHSAKLRTSGLNDDDIIAAKYFTITKPSEGKKLTGYNLPGLAIPYFDPAGEPYTTDQGKPFYRIRPDWGDDPDSDEKPKYLSPKNEGNRPYFAPTYTQWTKALRFTKIPIHITEGEFTAALLGKLGYATIGFAGVYAWKDKTVRADELEEIPAQLIEDSEFRNQDLNLLQDSRPLPELDFINNQNIWDGRKVYITFDSDVIHKWQVKNALKSLAIWLESKGAEPYIVLLPTELNGEKNGADDLVYRHGSEAYQLLLRSAEPALIGSKNKRSLNLPQDPTLPHKSDLLQAVLKDHWRYRPGIGWHQWTGTHWELTDDGAGTYIDDDIYRFMRENKWLSQGNGMMGNLLRHMKAKLMVKEWNPKHKIAFANGVLDINSGIFTPGLRREDFITVLLPYPYDPTAQCPTWMNFIGQALKGDSKAIDLVQAFFKWSLLPKPAGKLDIEVCWDLYGKPGTGKGTVLETLKQIVGFHNCGSFSTRTFKNDNSLAALIDKPVSICPDDSGHLDDVGMFNRLISNEPIQVKILYKNTFSATLNTFFVRAYNDFITAPSGSQGLNRRIVAMSFSHQPEVRDTELGSKLAEELPGIFNWAYAISRTEMKRRILWAGEVEAVADASIDRFLANNPACVFLQESFPDGGEVKIRDLYHQYQEWSKDSGRIPVNQRLFASSIKDFGCYQQTKIKGVQLYIIPPMKAFDVVRFLGIKSGTLTPEISPDLEKTEKRGEKGEKGEKGETVIPPLSPQDNPDLPTVPSEKGEKGEKGEKLFDIANTLPIAPISENTTNTPPIEESNTFTNPKGVLTYQKLLNGKIGTTIIKFERQSLAKEWLKLIEIVFGFYGTIEKITAPTDKYKYKIVYDKLDLDAIHRLEKKDLSKSPPGRE